MILLILMSMPMGCARVHERQSTRTVLEHADAGCVWRARDGSIENNGDQPEDVTCAH
jgi:hypothetical protein